MKKIQKVILGALTVLMLFGGVATAVVHASANTWVTRFTYSGTLIRGTNSSGSAHVLGCNDIRVRHAQTAWNHVPEGHQVMDVTVIRCPNAFSCTAVGAVQRFTGTFSTHRTFTRVAHATGTHRINFHAPINPAAASVNGEFQTRSNNTCA